MTQLQNAKRVAAQSPWQSGAPHKHTYSPTYIYTPLHMYIQTHRRVLAGWLRRQVHMRLWSVELWKIIRVQSCGKSLWHCAVIDCSRSVVMMLLFSLFFSLLIFVVFDFCAIFRLCIEIVLFFFWFFFLLFNLLNSKN